MMILQKTVTKEDGGKSTTLEGMLWIPNNLNRLDDSISSLDESCCSSDEEEDEESDKEQQGENLLKIPSTPKTKTSTTPLRGTPTRSTGGRIPRRQRASLPELRCEQLHLASPRASPRVVAASAMKRVRRCKTIGNDRRPLSGGVSVSPRPLPKLPATLSDHNTNSGSIYSRFLPKSAQDLDDDDDDDSPCGETKGTYPTVLLSGSKSTLPSGSDQEESSSTAPSFSGGTIASSSATSKSSRRMSLLSVSDTSALSRRPVQVPRRRKQQQQHPRRTSSSLLRLDPNGTTASNFKGSSHHNRDFPNRLPPRQLTNETETSDTNGSSGTAALQMRRMRTF